jgi:predicted RNase H-like nuclease
MTIKIRFTKVYCSINGCRQFAGWLARKYNCGNVASASNSHLVTPNGSSIYGVLISSDTARQWL